MSNKENKKEENKLKQNISESSTTEKNTSKEEKESLKQEAVETHKKEEKETTKDSQEIKNKETKEDKEKEPTEAEKLAKVEDDLAKEKDKYLRLAAEFDNYRKRTMKEKADLILNGGERILRELLPVLDDLDRAEQNIEKSEDVKTLKEGVELVFSKMKKTLSAQGLIEIETKDKDFDTDYHEAIAMIPTDASDKKGKVIDCVQKGYRINDKIIRHAKVAIGQ